jgi:glycosyltransferase involved in cell wall biosynthesis
MRVLHAYKAYFPELTGGIPEAISILSRSMGPAIKSSVITCYRESRLSRCRIVDDVPVERVRALGELSSMPLAPTFPVALRRAVQDFDVIVAHLPFPLIDLGIALGLPARVALVVHWHSEIHGRRVITPFLAPIIRNTVRRADSVVVSDASAITNSRLLSTYKEKCSIVPFGIDVEYWQHLDIQQRAEVASLQRKYPRLIVATGRLVGYKGFEILIRAMREIDAVLLIIGDGALRSNLENLAKQLGVTERVRLVGFVPREQLKIYLRAAQVFAFPSITASETFGIAQLEAMASGLPIVNTALPTGVPRVARHGVEAITVRPNDPLALRSAIQQLLDDHLLASRFGCAGTARARCQYSLERFVSNMADLYWMVHSRRLARIVRN